MKSHLTIVLATLIGMTLACGYGSKNYSSPNTSSMPAISNLNPASANAGEPGFTMTVTGSNFASKAVVNWNGAAQSTTFMTSGQLTMSVPAAALANAGTVQISVTNPGTNNGMYGSSPAQTSTAVPFTIH
jgi:hypothetical protein